MHRRDRGRTAARSRRPFPPPALSFAPGLPPDEHTRALAAALVETYSPACAWQWACAIDVRPGATGGPASITLRFVRHDAGSNHESILDRYEVTWREMVGAPVADVRSYARAILAEVAEWRQQAVLEHCRAWEPDAPVGLGPGPGYRL